MDHAPLRGFVLSRMVSTFSEGWVRQSKAAPVGLVELEVEVGIADRHRQDVEAELERAGEALAREWDVAGGGEGFGQVGPAVGRGGVACKGFLRKSDGRGEVAFRDGGLGTSAG